MLRTINTFCLFLFSILLFAQMPTDDIVLYGNEWIDYDKTYLRIDAAEDGVYRITPAQLAAAGFTGTEENWVLFHEGKMVPIEVTSGGILFVGERNDGEMDKYLFPDPEALQLNDRFNMHTDTSAYYLTRGEGGLRYTVAETTGAQPLTSILRKSEKIYGDYASKSFFRSGSSSIYYSHYDEAEGFGSRPTNDLLSRNGSLSSVTELDLPGSNGGTATLDLRFGLAFDGHIVNIEADGNNLETVNQSSWGVIQRSLTFTPNGEETTINVEGTRGTRDKPNLAWLEVTYPALPAYDEQMSSFTVPASTQASRIVLTDLGAAAGASGVVKGYAHTSGTMFSAEVAADGTATIEVPASETDQTYFLVVGDNARPAVIDSPLTFSTSLPGGNVNYLLLTSRRLHGPAVEELAAYRRSVAGGSYNVLVVDVEDLYDEFGYGTKRHPMAVRNYLAAARNVAPRLQYLFLVGKGREYEDLRRPGQVDSARSTFFVPSFGYPASDNLLSADLGEVVPNLATGRLSAITEEEIAIYAKKLRDVEEQINRGGQTIAERDWMKQIMHLGGGTTPGEQSSIKTRLTTMVDSVESSRMAPNVTSFFKSSSEPLEDSRSEAIFDRINEGLSVLSFMGHSSSQTFDFSIDDEANYRNANKYPFMVSLGCYSGDAFTEARSISERFIFMRDKGAVAFAASKGVGYISALGNWGTALYENLGDDHYGEGIGEAMRGTIERFANTSNFTLGILVEQFALSGDPAYRLHPRPGPDLVVDPASVSFTPDVVPAQDPEFTIKLRLLNLGTKAVEDSLNLRFRQELPSGEIQELAVYRVATPVYSSEVEFSLPNPGIVAVGQNRILISVDQAEEITELPAPGAELNNELETGGSAGIPLTFVANTAKVAFPPPYAVIGGELEFIASTTNVLAPARDYLIQISSDRNYDNLLINETFNQPGGVIRYRPSFSPADSTTYYWRISPDSSATEGTGFIWSESSFTWVADQPEEQISWAMQDVGQTIDGTFENILADTTAFGWNYARSVTDIKIFNSMYQSREMPRFEYNGQRFDSPHRWYIRAGIQMIVIDSTNSRRWYPNLGNGDYNTREIRNSSWDFDTRTEEGREGMIQFLDEFVPEGAYVMLYSVQRGDNTDYVNEGWLDDSVALGTTLYDVLEAEGALQVRGLQEIGSVPYLFSFQKGMGPIAEVLAESANDTITMEAGIFENWAQGKWRSEEAGPALAWDNVQLQLSDIGLNANDSIRMKVVGTGPNGEDDILRELVFDHLSSRNQSFDISDISHVSYPYLRAELDFFDETERSAPTVDYLYFNFASPGDAAINPAVSINLPDSIDQGQDLVINAGYENISRIGMDSLLVELSVVDASNNIASFTQRKAPLPPGATGQFTFTVPSVDYTQGVRYNVTLNPRQDQPENVIFNNVLNSRTKVGVDVIDPDLQIFFDGVRINNGDLVSSKPEIHIVLRDENRYLALNDTSAYFIELSLPGDGSGINRERQVIPFSDPRVEFLPATTSENVAEIFFRPELTMNGTYTIEIIGQDRSANFSGANSLRKDFEVINEQMVSNVLTYPNPFTTQTRFVYTLTGNEPPSTFRIQIMTVSGRVVRDIDLLAHEDIRIGTHQTEFAWDGTDEYGDLLANGVYLYRVITGDANGSSLEKYDTGTDQFFEREMGKVVILR